MSSPIVQLASVTRLYGTVIGVNDIALELHPGAYGLLGPNGAGKSTLLNLLTGQLTPTVGTVRVLGVNPRNNPALMQKLGYCPGFEGLYARVDGLEWVTYLLRLHGYSRSEAKERAIESMQLVGMESSMRRPIAAYSRGMRQRTKLAQALAHDPELLILDEPFSGLDPVGRNEMTEVLHDWIDMGKSLILASHVLHEIEALTQSFLLICGGRLLASGTAAEVNELLYDVPSEIRIRCSDPQQLAAALVADEIAESVQLERKPNGDIESVTVTTRHANSFYQKTASWSQTAGLSIFEMQSTDDSLQGLFNSLMRIHRGEM